MKQIVFLDIDGVIQTVESVVTQRVVASSLQPVKLIKAASPKSVGLLKALKHEVPDLQIVIHSSWLLDTESSVLKDVFDTIGLEVIVPVLARRAELSNRVPRLRHFIEQVYQPDQFVILDDAWSDIREGIPYLSSNQVPPIGQESGFDLKAFVSTVRYFNPGYKLPVCFF